MSRSTRLHPHQLDRLFTLLRPLHEFREVGNERPVQHLLRLPRFGTLCTLLLQLLVREFQERSVDLFEPGHSEGEIFVLDEGLEVGFRRGRRFGEHERRM